MLLFYDDELHENSCLLVQERLEEHFKSALDDVHVQVYYEKEDNRVIIGMIIFFDNKRIGHDYLIIELNMKNFIKTFSQSVGVQNINFIYTLKLNKLENTIL